MSKVLVTEGYLQDIGEAIRERNGSGNTYRPGEMAAAIRALEPVIEPLSVTENGTYAPPDGVDGYGAVTVNVPGGGGEGASTYPVTDALLSGTLDGYFELTVAGAQTQGALSEAVKAFINSYARHKGGTAKNGSATGGTVQLTESIARESVSDFLQRFPLVNQWEYYGCVYGNTAMIDALGLVLLGDFSQGGEASGNALEDAIENYSAVILQGIYNMQRTSKYNTSMLYSAPALNTAYWAGMKDRNSSYDCNVTFTDPNTVSLTGNRQVIIYGVP